MMGQASDLNMPAGAFNMNNIQVPNQNATGLPLQNNPQQMQQPNNNKNNLASSMADFLNTSNSNTPSSTFNNQQLFPNMQNAAINEAKARLQVIINVI